MRGLSTDHPGQRRELALHRDGDRVRQVPPGGSGRPLLEPGARPGVSQQPAGHCGCVHDHAPRQKTSGAPSMVQALGPKAAIMNNGPKTGGAEPAWQTIHESPGTPDIWQLHYALNNDAAHNAPDEFIDRKSTRLNSQSLMQLVCR